MKTNNEILAELMPQLNSTVKKLLNLESCLNVHLEPGLQKQDILSETISIASDLTNMGLRCFLMIDEDNKDGK